MVATDSFSALFFALPLIRAGLAMRALVRASLHSELWE